MLVSLVGRLVATHCYEQLLIRESAHYSDQTECKEYRRVEENVAGG